MDTSALGKWIVIIGLVVIGLGGLVWLVGRLGLPLGRLPGDFTFQWGGTSIMLACGTSIILSLLLTIVLNVVLRLISRR